MWVEWNLQSVVTDFVLFLFNLMKITTIRVKIGAVYVERFLAFNATF